MFRGELEQPAGVQTTELRRREGLFTRTVDQYLSFFGNSEVKIATLIAMDPEIAYSGIELYGVFPHMFIRQPVEGEGWMIGQPLLQQYCEVSLLPINFVEKTTARSKRFATKTAAYYQKTPDGVEFGDELGGLLMHFSYRHPEVSLYQLLGATNSSAITTEESEEGQRNVVKRQPAVRRRFYQLLLAEDTSLPTRVIDVATTMNERAGLVAKYAKSAGENHIIEFKSAPHGAPITAYRLSPDAGKVMEPAFQKEGYFPHLVYGALKNNPQRWWTIDEVTDLLLKARPNAIRGGTDEKSRRANMKHQAANMLSGLRDKGYAVVEGFDSSVFSAINVTPQQRGLLGEFLAYIDAFQNQAPQALILGNNFAQFLRETPKVLAQLILKGKEASPNAAKNAVTTEANMKAIQTTVDTHPDMTITQLTRLLRDNYQVTLSYKSLRLYLQRINESGAAISYPDKGGSRWRLVNV